MFVAKQKPAHAGSASILGASLLVETSEYAVDAVWQQTLSSTLPCFVRIYLLRSFRPVSWSCSPVKFHEARFLRDCKSTSPGQRATREALTRGTSTQGHVPSTKFRGGCMPPVVEEIPGIAPGCQDGTVVGR